LHKVIYMNECVLFSTVTTMNSVNQTPPIEGA